MNRKETIEHILDGFRLMALTLVIPVSGSIVCFLGLGVLGIETEIGLSGAFKKLWIDYYFTGHFAGISAWRWHLLLLIFAQFISFNRAT